jgi:RimJ/RimL family protein N-acetyltransferase
MFLIFQLIKLPKNGVDGFVMNNSDFSKGLIKNGDELIIRRGQVKDAKSIYKFGNLVGGESDNLTFGENEYPFTIRRLRAFLASNKISNQNLLCVGILRNQIVSVITLSTNHSKRMSHRADIGISVLKQYWGIGIASAMFEYVINWVKRTHTIRKLDLEVRSDNLFAIHLYEKFGFIYEGRITRGLHINGEFFDLVVMGLLID